MKNHLLFIFLIITVLVFEYKPAGSQSIDFGHYRPLQSRGKIPEAVKRSLSLHNAEEIKKELGHGDKKTVKEKKTFLMQNDCEIFQMIRNGNVLLGDTIGAYITSVARELLKDNTGLFEELNFYAIKNSSINAFSNNNGFVFVNIGLVANLKSEAELAFILAHEISHYIRKHPMEGHLENIKIIKGKSAYRFTSTNQKLDLLGKRARDIEFEADSIAISLLLASAYNPDAVIMSLEKLHYSYIPTQEESFDTRFFNQGKLVIPACFFLDSCAGKSPIKDTYDENYSHPNIFKRISRCERILKSYPGENGSDFLVSEKAFNYIREVARFEQVHLEVRNEEYGDAIYSAYCLLKRYPGNPYLEHCIAKALYGLAKYKNDDKYFYVARPYEKAEGPSQQLHFFLRQLNRKQLNVLSLSYIYELKKKYPAAAFLNLLETDLIDEMIINNKMDYLRFREATNSGNGENVELFLSRKEQQKKNENFYFTALKEAVTHDTAFIRKCVEATYRKGVEDKKPELSEKDRAEMVKKEMEKIRKEGIGSARGSLIILDPYFEIEMDQLEKEYNRYDHSKQELDRNVLASAAIPGLKSELISSRDINLSNNMDEYNRLCNFRELLRENMTHDMDRFYPVGADYFSNETHSGSNTLCYIGIYSDNSDDQYFLTFIDTSTGETLYWNEKKVKRGNLDTIRKYLSEDFHVLTRH